MMKHSDKIYVAGHLGLVGSSIVRSLQKQGFNNIITRKHAELELTDKNAVDAFFAAEKPDYVFLAAAKVGGIWANNNYPADFIYQNLQIQNNIIHAAYENKVQRLLFLGSSCIYPRNCPQPIKE
jgi:GDP-L-fucose synthase